MYNQGGMDIGGYVSHSSGGGLMDNKTLLAGIVVLIIAAALGYYYMVYEKDKKAPMWGLKMPSYGRFVGYGRKGW